MKVWETRYECQGDPSCGVWTHVEVSTHDDEPWGLPPDFACCPECGSLMCPCGPRELVHRHPTFSAN